MSLSTPIKNFLNITFTCLPFNCDNVSFRCCLARRGITQSFSIVCDKPCDGGKNIEKQFFELLAKEKIDIKSIKACITNEQQKRRDKNRVAYLKGLSRHFGIRSSI